MNRTPRKSSIAALLALLASLQWQAAIAEEFPPVDGAAEQVQSRRYQVEDPMQLLQASIAILQDIRYVVTKSEVDPGLVVAAPPWSSCRCSKSLTISLQEFEGREQNYLVRLTMSAPEYNNGWGNPVTPDHTDFYQDFFTHLDRELFKERQQ